MKTGMNIHRGDIVVVDFEPVVGSEQGGIRPCLIVQNDVSNKYSPLTIVAPIISRILSKKFITSVFIESEGTNLKNDSIVLLNQLRTIDKSRIRKKIGGLNMEIMKKVDKAIKISLDLN